MRILKKLSILSLAFGVSLLALSLSSSISVSAESETEANYIYTAKAGDSYTELARSSLIKYDLDTEEVELNAAQVTAAETWVTQEAGSPAINVGQEVSVSKASVEKFAAQAVALDEAAKARWQRYADASSITNTSLNEQVRTTTSEDKAKQEAEQKSAEQKAEEEKAQTEATAEDSNQKTSRRWVIIAIVALLVLAAVTLVRSSNAKDE